ncbi:hypothetical protein HOLleu_42250 [Holothuria leucospilota]|uniref:Uncharacterized protein n=1 Tax=Holothuria leucospilota TaxID=206669 RepID=A0A9Q0YF19_HOLLE|nr:hypothetical protein HOLleu_42250 [Holothuria leucospilota]
MEGLSHSYSEYVDLLKKRFEHLSQNMLTLQKHNQDKQNAKITNKLEKSPIYSVGQLVYLYKSTSSSLTANSCKIVAEWVGPLVIHEILDHTHYLLQTLQGDVLQDVFNFNRLKPCFVRASNESKPITSVDKLKAACNENVHVRVGKNFPSVQFQDEMRNVLPQVTCKDIFTIYHVEPIGASMCQENVKPNHNLAATVPLSKHQVKLQF